MTAWKKHNVPKGYIDLCNKRISYTNSVINGIDLIRKAIFKKSLHKKQFGTEAASIVINGTIFINFGCYTINSCTQHLQFNAGFIPLARIHKVDIV